MTDIETQANNLASSIVDHVNAIVLNCYLHGIFNSPVDETRQDIFGFDNIEAIRESLRRFITDCIGTDWWCVSDTWFKIVHHDEKKNKEYIEKHKIPIIRPINAQAITVDKAIEIEI